MKKTTISIFAVLLQLFSTVHLARVSMISRNGTRQSIPYYNTHVNADVTVVLVNDDEAMLRLQETKTSKVYQALENRRHTGDQFEKDKDFLDGTTFLPVSFGRSRSTAKPMSVTICIADSEPRCSHQWRVYLFYLQCGEVNVTELKTMPEQDRVVRKLPSTFRSKKRITNHKNKTFVKSIV
jgi:hypothetical protein